VRDAAHQTLVALAGGKDYGPADGRSADNRRAAGKWSAHFDDDRYESAAAAVLNTGRDLK
jgi:hypothetical protein